MADRLPFVRTLTGPRTAWPLAHALTAPCEHGAFRVTRRETALPFELVHCECTRCAQRWVTVRALP